MAAKHQTTQPRAAAALPKSASAKRAAPNRSMGDATKRTSNGRANQVKSKTKPVQTKAASVAGDGSASGAASAYAIMAHRLATRVAELAEGITFVERPKQKDPEPIDVKKRPRKLEMRLDRGSAGDVAFSAPFLDNTLQKMLLLQNRMLQTTSDLSKAGGVSESIIREHAAQGAELSRIIALICAEKARQGT